VVSAVIGWQITGIFNPWGIVAALVIDFLFGKKVYYECPALPAPSDPEGQMSMNFSCFGSNKDTGCSYRLKGGDSDFVNYLQPQAQRRTYRLLEDLILVKKRGWEDLLPIQIVTLGETEGNVCKGDIPERAMQILNIYVPGHQRANRGLFCSGYAWNYVHAGY
jgi:hypothetical protein